MLSNNDDINRVMDDEFHKFIELTKLKSCRKSFVSVFKERLRNNNFIFKGKYIYDAMISIFKRVLENVLEQDDTKAGYEIISILK